MRAVVLGARGAVGRSCVAQLLTAGVEVLAVGRDATQVAAACPGARIHPGLDLEDLLFGNQPSGAIADLLVDADVVVCCAGPSHRYSEAVARLVLEAGVRFVDPGAEGLVPVLSPLAAASGTSALLGAGVQPGLVGLAVTVATARLGQPPRQVHGWCGGLQPLTLAGIQEYLHAAQQGNRVGTMLARGRHVAVRPEQTPPPPAPFPPSAVAHSHLDEEAEDRARASGSEHLHWANVTDGAVTATVLGRCLGGDASVQEAIAAARTDLFGRQPYFHILVEATDGRERSWARVSCTDSYAATGAVCAATALVTDAPPGAHNACSHTDPAASWNRLADMLAPRVRLSLGVGPGFGETATIEEGEL
ncbi:MAG: NAD(P)H-binding protein [Arachnia propionica]|uniref:NAD(P)H-binding protein n=1 Tax=Arachnia propionica TaxID=1750 RepID=UPI00270246B6|nr:NAD(P)H-binding protein [Arachnia propionica]